MQRFGLLTLLAVLACEPTPTTTTSGADETTSAGESTAGTADTSDTSDTGDTGAAPTTADETTGDPVSTSSESTGDTSTDETDDTTSSPTTGGTQVCPDPRGECLTTGVWCVDLALFCERIDLADVSPNFCEGLAGVCATGEVSPCETCAGLVEQCEIGGAVESCDDIAAECACLAQ